MADRAEVVRLREDPDELELWPDRRGSIAAFRHRGRDLAAVVRLSVV